MRSAWLRYGQRNTEKMESLLICGTHFVNDDFRIYAHAATMCFNGRQIPDSRYVNIP